MARAILDWESPHTIYWTHHPVTTTTLSIFSMAVSFQSPREQHIDIGEVLRTVLPIANADKIGKMLSEATDRSRPKQNYTASFAQI